MKTPLYYCLESSHFKLDGGAMYGIIPRPLWSKNSPPDEFNRIDLSLRLMLIMTNQRKILIDTGIGTYHSDKFNDRFAINQNSDEIELALAKIKLKPNDITDIILSHLHFDHVGGLTKIHDNAPMPRFPNSRIHLHPLHYQYALSPTPRDQGSFQEEYFGPVIEYYIKRERVHWLKDNQPIIQEEDYCLNFKTSHGHTPYMIHPYDHNFIYLADLIPTSYHIPIPWVMGYDMSPGITAKDKEIFLPYIEEKDLWMIFEHDPNICAAKISDNGRKYQMSKQMESKGHSIYELEF